MKTREETGNTQQSRGRPKVLEDDEFLEVGVWCEEQWQKHISGRLAAQMPPEFEAHTNAIAPLRAKHLALVKQRDEIDSGRHEIDEFLRKGEIQKLVAEQQKARERQRIEVELAELANEFRDVTASIFTNRETGESKLPMNISVSRLRPYSLRNVIEADGAKYFSAKFEKPVTERAVRSAWDWLRGILAEVRTPSP